jgi:hypothetical protein
MLQYSKLPYHSKEIRGQRKLCLHSTMLLMRIGHQRSDRASKLYRGHGLLHKLHGFWGGKETTLESIPNTIEIESVHNIIGSFVMPKLEHQLTRLNKQGHVECLAYTNIKVLTLFLTYFVFVPQSPSYRDLTCDFALVHFRDLYSVKL